MDKPACRIDAPLSGGGERIVPPGPGQSREGFGGFQRESPARNHVAARFGSFTLATDSRQLTRAGEALHLTPKAFDLLTLLVDAAPRVLPKAELHARLWPDTFVSDATLVGLVKEVRRVLGDAGAAAPIVRTVARVGYAFAAPLERQATPRVHGHWLVADGRSFPLDEGVNSIGREPSAAVWLDSGSVSRRHATITVGNGAARIEDTGSKNGTQVNGAPVRGAVTLRDGDHLLLGTVPLTYRTSATGLSTETRVTVVSGH
jgi:DNA-binding winged helix-turn-helix (wHTH) protein